MKLTLLGTGDATGVPMYGCDCPLCTRAQTDRSYRRTPCSALLEVNGKRYLIDGGQTDLAERFPHGSLDGIFLTHFHPDHVQGLFHLRWGIGQSIPVYCPPDSEGCGDLYKNPGRLQFKTQMKFQTFILGDLSVTPLPMIHSKPTHGYLFSHQDHHLAYLTDTKGLPPKVMGCLQSIRVNTLVIDTTAKPGVDNRNHNNLGESLLLAEQLKAEKTVLTHIGHDLAVWLETSGHALPESVTASWDMQKIGLEEK